MSAGAYTEPISRRSAIPVGTPYSSFPSTSVLYSSAERRTFPEHRVTVATHSSRFDAGPRHLPSRRHHPYDPASIRRSTPRTISRTSTITNNHAADLRARRLRDFRRRCLELVIRAQRVLRSDRDRDGPELSLYEERWRQREWEDVVERMRVLGLVRGDVEMEMEEEGMEEEGRDDEGARDVETEERVRGAGMAEGGGGYGDWNALEQELVERMRRL
ncbi:MAG: hypothetical protein LQ352_002032 [Teloschistes flavicans]|nr:MAG: hypothetical protein LQ352_002032 [Teloschistes flavicans]